MTNTNSIIIDEEKAKKRNSLLKSITISQQDFEDSRNEISPSFLRTHQFNIPNVSWEDVGGLEDVKQNLRELFLFPKTLKRMNLPPPRGVLLHGPPGCGKTLIGKALANQHQATFLSVKGPEILNMYLGESERAVRNLFKLAKQHQPSIIFFDEMDALAPSRSSSSSKSNNTILNQLLTELDGVEIDRMDSSSIFIMGATNRPDMIDSALLRPGRFDQLVFIGLPDQISREKVCYYLLLN